MSDFAPPSAPRVLCLGEVLYDYLADQPGLAYHFVRSWTAYPGGAPANVACALAKLGTAAGFIGCVGQDAAGTALVQVLQTAGVDTAGVQGHPTAPTRSVYVVRSQDGDRQFAGFGKGDAGERDTTAFADCYLQADALPKSHFAQAEYLVLGSLELAYPTTRRAVVQALDWADANYLKILLDVNWRPVFWPDANTALRYIRLLLPRVDFLKLSDEEAQWLFGTTHPEAIAERLDHLEGVLVTAGDKGCAYSLSGNLGQVPAFPVDVEDTTGAGDGFVAGFLHQLCARGLACLEDADQARQVVRYASAVGGLTASHAGAIAAQPTGQEVEAFLYLHEQMDS
jgi:fructokinase